MAHAVEKGTGPTTLVGQGLGLVLLYSKALLSTEPTLTFSFFLFGSVTFLFIEVFPLDCCNISVLEVIAD